MTATTARPPLIEGLIDRQRELGEDDGAFALALGVSRPFWVQIRNGKRRPGPLFLQGVMRRFPALGEACLVYIRDTPALFLPVDVANSNITEQ